MTKEEAAEEILKGPYTTCTHCKGDGAVMTVHPGVGERCKSCKGSGKWRRGDYVRACVLLAIEPKEQPSGFRDWVFTNPEPWPKPLTGEDLIRLFKHQSILQQGHIDFSLKYVGIREEPRPNTGSDIDGLLGKSIDASDVVERWEYMGEWYDTDEHGRSSRAHSREQPDDHLSALRGRR